MPRYTRKSYFNGQNAPEDLTHSVVFDATDDADAVKQAANQRFRPGTTASRLYDEHDRFVCDLDVPQG
jgi:hypothetical protein